MSAIADAALAALRRWGATLPEWPRLRALMAPRVGDDARARFRRVAQPVMDLPIWLAADMGVSDARATAAVEAALVGYLYVGLVDGALDGAAADPGDGPLAQRLFAHHRARLAAAGDVSSDLFDDCWQAFADGSARRGDGDLAASVARARPLALPGAALLPDDAVGALLRLVGHSTRAAQLYDDLVDAERDLAAGRHTAVVRRLNGLDGLAALRHALHLGGGADAVLADVMIALDAARAVASEQGWPTVSAGLTGEEHRVRAYRRALAGALAEAIFGRAPDPPGTEEHVR